MKSGLEQMQELWSQHVGSTKLSARAEIAILQRLDRDRVLTHGQVRKLYLLSKVWRAIRWQVIRRDGRACVKCGVTRELHVHHMRYHEIGHEVLSDLQTLCADCHRKETLSYDLTAGGVKRRKVDSSGEIFLGMRR